MGSEKKGNDFFILNFELIPSKTIFWPNKKQDPIQKVLTITSLTEEIIVIDIEILKIFL